jgi:hypothetical protein
MNLLRWVGAKDCRNGLRTVRKWPVRVKTLGSAAALRRSEAALRGVLLRGASVLFEDGAELTFDAVVWATGFTTDHSWIEADILDSNGQVVQQRGVTPAPGLDVLGLPWMHTRGSALLGWVGDDAAYLAQNIADLQGNAADSLQAGSLRSVVVSVLLG